MPENAIILCRSDAGDGGWSLHRPGTTNEQIANGEGILLTGTATWDDAADHWDAPTLEDYEEAERLMFDEAERRMEQPGPA